MLRPLTDVLYGSPPQALAVVWTDDMQRAFRVARESLARKVELVHPCPRAQLFLCVDTSANHVGAVLQQCSSASAAWQA